MEILHQILTTITDHNPQYYAASGEALALLLKYIYTGEITYRFESLYAEKLYLAALEILIPYLEKRREADKRRADRKVNPEKYPKRPRKPTVRRTSELKTPIASNERQARQAEYYFIDADGNYIFLIQSGWGRIKRDADGHPSLYTVHFTDILRAARKSRPNDDKKDDGHRGCRGGRQGVMDWLD